MIADFVLGALGGFLAGAALILYLSLNGFMLGPFVLGVLILIAGTLVLCVRSRRPLLTRLTLTAVSFLAVMWFVFVSKGDGGSVLRLCFDVVLIHAAGVLTTLFAYGVSRRRANGTEE